jgi:hypothetical protein
LQELVQAHLAGQQGANLLQGLRQVQLGLFLLQGALERCLDLLLFGDVLDGIDHPGDLVLFVPKGRAADQKEEALTIGLLNGPWRVVEGPAGGQDPLEDCFLF